MFVKFVLAFFCISLFSLACDHEKTNGPEQVACDPLTFADTSRTYFWYDGSGEKTELLLVPFAVHIAVDTSLNDMQVDSLFDKYQLRRVNRGQGLLRNNFVVWVPPGKRAEEFFTFYGAEEPCGIGNIDEVHYATPVFWGRPHVPGDSSITMLSDEFAIRIDTTLITIDKLLEMGKEDKIEMVLDFGFRSTYLLRVTKDSPMNALDTANKYHTFDHVRWAAPNFYEIIQRWLYQKQVLDIKL